MYRVLNPLSILLAGILSVMQIACKADVRSGFQEESNKPPGGDEEHNQEIDPGKVVPVNVVPIDENHKCTTWLESFLGEQVCRDLKVCDQEPEYPFRHFFNVVCQEARYAFLEESLQETPDSILLGLVLKELNISSLRLEVKLWHFKDITTHTKKGEDLANKICTAARNSGSNKRNHNSLVRLLLKGNYVDPKKVVEACAQRNSDYKNRVYNLLIKCKFDAQGIINKVKDQKKFSDMEKGSLLQELTDNGLIQKSDLTDDDRDYFGLD